MITKYVSAFALFLVLVVAMAVVGVTTAQAATFPDGCGSALGYSATTGSPCNGTSTATMPYLPGCNSALGYSDTNGAPCSGGSVAIAYLQGCSSIYGYSSESGQPCNGTTVVSWGVPASTPPSGTPGLPTTGAGGDAARNAALLISLGAIVIAGGIYFSRRTAVAK